MDDPAIPRMQLKQYKQFVAIMDEQFSVKQLPDNLLKQAGIVSSTDGDMEALARLAIHQYNVTPMREQQPNEQIERLTKVMTLRQGEPGLETPAGKRSIAIILENGSVAIQVKGARENQEQGAEICLTRNPCQRNTVFVMDEGVVIGIPKDGVPGAGDKYPNSIKLLLVKLGYVQK